MILLQAFRQVCGKVWLTAWRLSPAFRRDEALIQAFQELVRRAPQVGTCMAYDALGEATQRDLVAHADEVFRKHPEQILTIVKGLGIIAKAKEEEAAASSSTD